MGETGVGKTSLVNYLADLMDSEFLRFPMHAGIEEADIIAYVMNTIQYANANKGKSIILFIDEVNTNEHINGILKELIIDRHFNG